MLRRTLLVPAVMLILSTVVEIDVNAQSPVRRPRRPSVRSNPPVSPYLNLLRRDASIGENYFNLVRPQQEFRQGIVNNNQEIGQLRQQTNNLQLEQQDTVNYIRRQAAGSRLGVTGHTSSFMNHSQYYGGGR
ncbi:hypothetical protein [Symmachiella dynata]|uniref:Uncharacterized protein n=1 Tax=Symmachiella dynata TaxID=2527995 RepID=A0A517ZJ54_9PLAN|nr:hypothetical protein [Symmachiella dynata]QDT47006.1 hypothetical protein Pan258_10330 [Symmachiella dynata]QDU42510.1 hypothetical protein Mal52_09730 [Symmachiella dynata]